MILLDTNVVSEPIRPRPFGRVRAWIDSQPARSLFLCTPVLAELRYGVERLPAGSRRERLDRWVHQLESEHFVDRILPVDQQAAHVFGRIVTRRERSGRPIKPMDALIASVAINYGLAVATRDVQDFADLGLELINPFVASTER